MTTSVRYTGTAQQFFEIALTGRPRQWTPGQQQDVSDADAATLIATNSFVPANPQRARSAGQLAAAPSAADIALSGEFFLWSDPSQRYVVNAALTAYVAVGGGTGAVSSVAGKTGAVSLTPSDVGAIGLYQNWNGTTPALVSSTNPVPSFGTNAFVYTGAGGAVLDGNVFQTGDLAIFSGGVFTKTVLGGGYLGSFGSSAALQTAYPAASNTLSTALVAGAPFVSNGTAWAGVATLDSAGFSLAAQAGALTGDVTRVAGTNVTVLQASAPVLATKEPVTTVGTTGNQTLASSQNNQVIPTSTNSVITVNTGLLPAQGFGCAFIGAGVVTFAGTATTLDKRTTGAANPACSLVPMGTDTYWVIGSKA